MSSAWCDAVLSWLLPLAGLSSTKVRWTDEPGHEMAQFHHHHCVYVCRINVGVFCQQGLCTGLSQGSGVLNISWVEGFEQSEFKMRIPSRKLPVMERRPWVWGSKLLLLRLLHFILLNLNLIWFFFFSLLAPSCFSHRFSAHGCWQTGILGSGRKMFLKMG